MMRMGHGMGLGKIAAGLVLLVAATAHADVNLDLDFDSLPSAQGWSYAQQGADADGETENYNATGSVLELRRFGKGMGSTPGGARYSYDVSGSVNPVKPLYARIVTAVYQSQFNDARGIGSGYFFDFHIDGRDAWIGFSATSVYVNGVAATLPGGFDLSAFNTYDLMLDPVADTYQAWANGSPLAAGSLSAGSGSVVRFGDGTTWANVDADLAQLTVQQEPIPEPASVALFGLGGLALLRRRR